MESQEQRNLKRGLRAQDRGRGKRYPAELKARAIEFVLRRREAGLSYGEIGTELGLPLETVRRWWLSSRASSSPNALLPVEVITAPSPSLSVSSPSGYRIDGLTLEQAALLMRALR